jgi:2-dehydropantoate 2-reductase
MRVLIYGAGVIGQVYAGRLHKAGHDVVVFARNPTLESLARAGIVLVRGAETYQAKVEVTGHIGSDDHFDVVLVTVRRDQLDEALPAVAALPADRVVLMQNNPSGAAGIGDAVGRDRVLFGFPGVGGYRRDDGVIEYIEIAQQPTTLGRSKGREKPVEELLKSAGFAVKSTDDMDAWLKTHAVFIAAAGASIEACGGDAAALAADRDRVAAMVKAVGEGFRALAAKGVAVQPLALKAIFTIVPAMFAVPYWQGQLRGPVGMLSLAPHFKATRDTELVGLCRDVRALIAGTVPTPHLDELLAGAQT